MWLCTQTSLALYCACLLYKLYLAVYVHVASSNKFEIMDQYNGYYKWFLLITNFWWIFVLL